MLPIFLFHPYIAGSLVALYVGHWHFNPAKNALILDSEYQLGEPLTPADRRLVQNELEELAHGGSVADANLDERDWTSLYAAGEPAFDASGGPTLQVRLGGEVTSVGIARRNLMNIAAGSEFAVGLVRARLHEELKSAVSQKRARADVESDLVLLQRVLAQQSRELASTTGFASERRILSSWTAR